MISLIPEHSQWDKLLRYAVGPVLLIFFLVVLGVSPLLSDARAEASSDNTAATEPDLFSNDVLSDTSPATEYVADPLEPLNRVFFTFNDKLYFWLIKPVSQGYKAVLPGPAREGIDNFFFNLRMPKRLVNNLLQGKLKRGGVELTRFAINTTIGIVGFFDPARHWFDFKASKEDLGLTLGKYGLSDGIYICWPFLGSSNLRDSVGLAGDYFLDPVNYLALNNETSEALAVKSEETVNHTSLRLGDYEAVVENSFDPYSAIRDGYTQRRHYEIKHDPDN